MLVRKAEIIEVLGINTNTLTSYINDGMGGRVGSGNQTKYDLRTVLEFHLARVIAKTVKTQRPNTNTLEGIPEIEVSKQLSAHWQAVRDESAARASSKKWLTVDKAERMMAARLAQIRNALDAVPGQIAPFLVEEMTLAETQRKLDDQMNKVFDTLAVLPDMPDTIEDPTNEPDESD